MKIDQSKLKNVVSKGDGKITAQCPACAAEGADAKGVHLVVFRDGKFGCVVNEGDKAHNRKILQLAGTKDRGDGASNCRLTVEPMQVPESKVIMKVGRLGRAKATSGPEDGHSPSQKDAAPEPREAVKTPPERPKSDPVHVEEEPAEDFGEGITDEDVREFLEMPVV
jgi:hypothetical protein